MKTIKFAVLVFAMLWGSVALAQGRIAVFDLEATVLNTDVAKQRLNALRNQKEFKNNVSELEQVRKDYEKLVEQFQKDLEILSAEQRQLAKNKIDTKRSDGEHLARKIEAAQQQEVLTEAGRIEQCD